MANYLTRKFVCERLRLSRWQSYQIVGSSYGSRISSDDVLDILNRSRRGQAELLRWLPHDLLTPEELSAELAESGISTRELLNWTRRTRPNAVPPHFRLTRRTIRFSRSSFMEWLDARSRLKPVKARVA
jgi:predicted DNA-binding transcriptional regulator AlpA